MTEVWPPATSELIAGAMAIPPSAVTAHVQALVSKHDDWRRHECINLNPAESALSQAARTILASDMAARLSEGFPGDRQYPRGPQNRFSDQIEAMVIALAMRLFNARYVEWRPVSTSMANTAVFLSFLKAGDRVIAQSQDGGGNHSYQPEGVLGAMGVEVIAAPCRGTGAFEVDAAALEAIAQNSAPRMIIVGGSNVCAPYPLTELRHTAERHGALLLFDAAHLGLLIAHGEFPDPLAGGAHLMTVSTHKVLGGPVGGLILTNDPGIAARLHRSTFPGLVQTRDQNKFASLAISLAEAMERGAVLARQMKANARRLQEGLALAGLGPACCQPTSTHQIFAYAGDQADMIEARCQASGILLASCMLEGDYSLSRRTGLRLATHEVTRSGMGGHDMDRIASLIARAASGLHAADAIRSEVRSFLGEPRARD